MHAVHLTVLLYYFTHTHTNAKQEIKTERCVCVCVCVCLCVHGCMCVYVCEHVFLMRMCVRVCQTYLWADEYRDDPEAGQQSHKGREDDQGPHNAAQTPVFIAGERHQHYIT